MKLFDEDDEEQEKMKATLKPMQLKLKMVAREITDINERVHLIIMIDLMSRNYSNCLEVSIN